jgi:hypothetical protein
MKDKTPSVVDNEGRVHVAIKAEEGEQIVIK